MDKLHDSLLLHILSRLDDSADVARCRVASKAFNTVFPGLRSINLDINLSFWDSKSLKKVFLDHVLKLETVESVSIDICDNLNDDKFFKEWLPRVSESLKSLAMSAIRFSPVGRCKSNVLLLISAYCHNLVTLKLKSAWLRTHNLNPMAMLTSLTLKQIDLVDESLNKLNKCFPNLQVLNMEGVRRLYHLEIRHLNLKAFRLADVYSDYLPSLTLITPNLITLKIACFTHIAIHVEAPMLSHYHLSITAIYPKGVLASVQYENPRVWSDTCYISSLLSNFSTTKSLQSLKLYLGMKGTRDTPDSKVSIVKVLTPFPNVSSERINSRVWSEIEAGFNPKDLENFNVRKELKSICAYLIFGDLSWTIASVACVLDKCVGLSEVSLLIHSDVSGSELSKSFMSKCMVVWPGLKWKWGIWNEHSEDSWINTTDHLRNTNFVY